MDSGYLSPCQPDCPHPRHPPACVRDSRRPRDVNREHKPRVGRWCMKVSVTSASERRATVADWLDSVVPDWLAEVMVPKKAAPPWGTMARAVVAIWAPLAVGFIAGHREIGLLPAMGGLLSIMIDNGGTLRARVRRGGTAAIFGRALGVAIGSLIYGRGWV